MDAAAAKPPLGGGENPFIAPYFPRPPLRDEAMDTMGNYRPGWEEIFESVGQNGDSTLSAWRKESARISRQRGLAYRPAHIDGAERGNDWSLDPIPWLFSPEAWEPLETGIIQRMRLFDAILTDLYSSKSRILDEQLVPAEIILSHRGFLRALHSLKPGKGVIGLGLSAIDLAYDSAGQPFILNDRFDCPFGLGLTLENRTVVNKVLPDLFRRCRTQRIAQFYLDWFEYLLSLVPGEVKHPRIVIIDSTPDGQDSEISFLANYCGILRVTPTDLTVRDSKVWLKALSGLKRVDLIWKYTAGPDLDPLEVSHSETVGIPGLFEAVRKGNVMIASHPGCEVLQSPGLYPYLAKLCEALLSEPLKIPPVATWWCGKPSAKDHVLANLSRMVIKSVGHHSSFATIYGSQLTKEALNSVRDQIESDPAWFVGQEELTFSTVPASTSHGLTPKTAVLRTFSFIGADGRPNLMPGGLARIGIKEGSPVSTRLGGESKDVWIQSQHDEGIAPQISIATEVRRSRLIGPEVVPSQVAENLFWTGRYAERTDFFSRCCNRVIEGRAVGFSHGSYIQGEHEHVLLNVLFEISECESWFENASDADSRLQLILSDPTCPISIPQNLANFRRATKSARGMWSPTSSMAIESLWDGWAESTNGLSNAFQYQSPLESLQLGLNAFLGLNLDSMTREEGWAVLDAGRRIERITNYASLLSCLFEQKTEGSLRTLLYESVLFITDSLGTYQSMFLTEPKAAPMLRLLLSEENYPRSIHFLLNRVQDVLKPLPAPVDRPTLVTILAPAIEQLLVLVSKVNLDREESIPFLNDASADLNRLVNHLNDLCDYLTKSYFSHAEPTA